MSQVMLKTYRVGDILQVSFEESGYKGKVIKNKKAKIVKRGPNWIKIQMSGKRESGEKFDFTKTITKRINKYFVEDGAWFKAQIKFKKVK